MSRRKQLLRLSGGLLPLAPGAAMALIEWGAPRLPAPRDGHEDPHLLDAALITELLGPQSGQQLEELLHRSRVARLRGIVLRHGIGRRGLDVAGPLLRWTPGSRERLGEFCHAPSGVIFTTWHAGPTLGLWAGLAGFDLALLKFQVGDRFPAPPGWVFIDPDRQGGFRAGAMKRALAHLRNGGCVAVPADMYQWSSRVVWARCLDRRVAFSRAVPALAQLSGAPVVPLFAWWSPRGAEIVLDVQGPLDATLASLPPTAESETAPADALARRVEVYLRDHLDEYDGHYARMFAAHERWPDNRPADALEVLLPE